MCARRIHRLRVESLALFVSLLVWLPVNATVEASVGPPLRVRVLEATREAASGGPIVTTIEIVTPADAPAAPPSLEGDGWIVHSLELLDVPLPEELVEADARSALSVQHLRISATPSDRVAPLVLSFELPRTTVRVPLGLVTEERADPNAASADVVLETGAPGVDPPLRVAPPGSGADGGVAGGREIRVRGRFWYARPDGQTVGVDGGVVELFDDDPLQVDPRLATTVTDVDGRFDVTFNWDPSIFGDSQPDIYARCVARNHAVVVEHPITLLDVKYETIRFDNYTGSDLDMGAYRAPADDAPAFHILTNITRAWYWLRDTVGYSTPKVDVHWPSPFDPHFEFAFEDIHLDSASEWRESTIVHEYAHHWIYRFGHFDQTLGICGTDGSYCNGICDTCPVSPPCACIICGHCAWCEESPVVAWQEGFPDWFSDVVLRSFGPTYGLVPVHHEPFESLRAAPSGSCSGEQDPLRTEGFVAALLRDIEDANKEDDPMTPGSRDCLALGADEILAVVQRDEPRTVTDFIESFAARYPDQAVSLAETAANNGFTFTPPPPPTSASFSDVFDRPDGAVPGWSTSAGLWRIEGGALGVDTRERVNPPILQGRVVAVSRGTDSIDVLAAGENTPALNGHFVHYAWSEIAGWSARDVSADLGVTRLITQPVVLHRPDRLDVFGSYGQGATHFRWTASAGWSADLISADSQLWIGPRLTALRRSETEMDVFGVRSGRIVHHAWSEAGGWRSEDVHSRIGLGQEIYLSSELTAILDSSVVSVFGITVGGHLVHFWWNPTSDDWSSEDVTVEAGVEARLPLSVHVPVTAFAYSFRRLDVHGVSPGLSTGRLVVFSRSRLGWSAQPIAEEAGYNTPGRPAVFENADGGIEIVTRGDRGIGDPQRIIHFAPDGTGDWNATDLSSALEAQGLVVRSAVDPIVLRDGGGTPQILVLGGGPIRIVRTPEGGWRGEIPTDEPHIGSDYFLSGSGVGVHLAAASRSPGRLDIFGGGLWPATSKHLIHFGRSAAGDWTADDLTGGTRGGEATIRAGQPSPWFFGIESVEFTLEFLARPADSVGRHAGLLLFAQSPLPRTGNSGYSIDWIDRDADRGYRVSRIDCGVGTPLNARTGHVEPGRAWRVEVDGATVRVLADCELVAEFRDTSYRRGHVGFWAYSNGQQIRIDDVVIGATPSPCEDGAQVPGDCNQDARLDLSDAICLFGHLFLGSPVRLPCGDGTLASGANVALLDHNGNGAVDISDGIGLLQHLFGGGLPPALGEACVAFGGCPSTCAP